jgi:lipopolysaccharide export LptBFGC system permease protein LptF
LYALFLILAYLGFVNWQKLFKQAWEQKKIW